ncbi:P-loop containing nucleoside triphosphate hydrolase protein [Ilyonectria robusta]|uniref:P-loop containing nucleoside triphosphate hydrolase protein n=1 Tax=Ilyonectria robusta TaxID=1079257 RepID=UPI001E8EA507|nr:P-loop containing nucleoside triphosphate hydrolase protein [Ilyonectria robusta]KAH8662687.1 P-loop containing nucleoside triphosphate hydrolase protein [Ilyonectria robusta]
MLKKRSQNPRMETELEEPSAISSEKEWWENLPASELSYYPTPVTSLDSASMLGIGLPNQTIFHLIPKNTTNSISHPRNKNHESSSISTFKIGFLGAAGVGKTCLIITHSFQYFPSEYIPSTVDPPAISTFSNPSENTELRLEIHDTAGLRKWDIVPDIPDWYSSVDVFCLLFSLTDEQSLNSLRRSHRPYIQRHAMGRPFIVVGTKADEREGWWEEKCSGLWKYYEKEKKFVPFVDGVKVAREMGAAAYLECSALKGEGVEEVFRILVEVAMEHRQREKKVGKKGCFRHRPLQRCAHAYAGYKKANAAAVAATCQASFSNVKLALMWASGGAIHFGPTAGSAEAIKMGWFATMCGQRGQPSLPEAS